MPRVTFVKAAQKDNELVKKGEPYYWWKFRYGGKHLSRTAPKPSQLTQSEFWGTVYGIQEGNESVPAPEDVESQVDSIKDELEALKDETDDKYNNLPENFQNGASGELLQERVEALDSAISELDGLDFDGLKVEDIDDEDVEEGEGTLEERKQKMAEEKAENVWEEVTSALGISCS